MTTFLSVGETATFFGKSEKWVYLNLAKGLIPGAFKFNGSWFIDKEILVAELKRRATKKKVPATSSGNRHDI